MVLNLNQTGFLDYRQSVKNTAVLGICFLILVGADNILRQALTHAYSLLSVIPVCQVKAFHHFIAFHLSKGVTIGSIN